MGALRQRRKWHRRYALATRTQPRSALRAGTSGPLPLQPTPVGVVRFIAGDELQQDGASLVIHPSGALDGGDDLGGLFDPFRVSAQGASQLGIVRAGDP